MRKMRGTYLKICNSIGRITMDYKHRSSHSFVEVERLCLTRWERIFPTQAGKSHAMFCLWSRKRD
jgi:hypothetical protein